MKLPSLAIALALVLIASCGREAPPEDAPAGGSHAGGEASAPTGDEPRPAEEEAGSAQEDGRPALSEEDRALVALLGDDPRAPIPLYPSWPRLGPEAETPVSILLFSDMQCPFCARAMHTLERVLAHYDGKVRLYWLHFPLPSHPQADVAARVSVAVHQAAGDAAFFAFLEGLTSNLEDFSDARIEEVAEKHGASEEAILAAMDEYVHDEAVVFDRKIGQMLGISGTPFMLVNGRPVAGAQPFEVFTELIDDELRVVEALRDAGVPEGREYETLVRLVFGPEAAASMRASD